MRTLLLTLATLACLTAALPLAAQAQDPGPTPLLEDPAGDVAATAGNTAPLPQAGTWTALDMRSLSLTEDPAGFRLEVQMEDLGEDGPRTDYGNTNLRFSYGGAFFTVNMYRSQDNAAYFGNMYRAEQETGPYTIVRGLPVERDLAADRIWTTVDRFDLVGVDGKVPERGQQITGLRAFTYGNLPGIAGYSVLRVGDAMPDAGLPEALHTVLFGGGESHGVRLTTPAPFRASNGEATVYQFEVNAQHDGEGDVRFRVFVENVPAGWNVSLPGDIVELPVGKPLSFPVLVQTVFRHQHGSAESFQLHLHEEDGDRWASLDLGVNFLAVAQPAGHHPLLYLHSNDWSGTAAIVNAPLGSTGGYVTMNTLEQDPADTAKPILGRSEVVGYNTGLNTNAVGVSRFRWSVCLEPGLQLGLDFDLAREGTVEVPISTVRPMPGAHLSGRLLHLGAGDPLQYCFPYEYQARETTLLAELDFGATDLSAGAAATYGATLTPLPAADYIPAQDGALLVLELTLETVGMGVGGVGGASLEPGGWLELPLNEYHDAVSATLPSPGSQPVAGFVADDAPAKDAPGLALPLLAVAVLALAFARRHA